MSNHPRIDVAELKQTANGRWTTEILPAADLPVDVLDGRHHPCPKCGGEDRFRMIDANSGAIICNQCFYEQNGDGIAAVQWIRDCTFRQSLEFIADKLGIVQDEPSKALPEEITIVMRTAKAKSMPLEAFQKFGPKPAKRYRKVVCRVPVYNGAGETHSYFDMRPGDGKLDKGMLAAGKGMSGMFFPNRLPAAGETWLVVEGVKDAAALVGLGYLAAGMPRNELSDEYGRLFRDVDVVFVHDLDEAGIKGADRSAARLAGLARSVRVARLPGDIRKTGGDDVRDVLRRRGEDVVRQAINEAVTWKPSPDHRGDRVEVVLDLDESITTAAVMEELAKVGWNSKSVSSIVFQRGGTLVHVTTNDIGGLLSFAKDSMRIRPLPKSLLRERITQAVTLVQEGEEEDKLVRPPGWLVNGIHERGEYPPEIRPLTGIIEAPTLRPDGSIIQDAGYDELTGLLYQPSCEFPRVPDHPTRENATDAVFELLAAVGDFPFVNDDHRMAWLSLVLTLIGRPAIDGPCPLFAIDANARGSGKSMLSDVASIIASGHITPRKTWPRDDEETRKTITAVALEATPAVLIDNVAGLLGGASLDAALTSTSWTDRILGKSETTGTLPLTTVWIATGNNLELGADTARRTLICRLESDHENPEDREDFQHRDLLGWVRANRPALATAAVTILRAYFVAGCPGADRLQTWGSFEAWSRVVRGSLVYANCPDPIGTRELVRAADRSAEILGLIHEGIVQGGNELTTSEIVNLIEQPMCEFGEDRFPSLRAAVGELCGSRVDGRKLGYRLRPYLGRVRAGHRLENRAGHGNVKRWSVVPVNTRHHSPNRGGDGGDGGDAQHSSNTRTKNNQSTESMF